MPVQYCYGNNLTHLHLCLCGALSYGQQVMQPADVMNMTVATMWVSALFTMELIVVVALEIANARTRRPKAQVWHWVRPDVSARG